MNCDCIKDLEARLAKQFSEQAGTEIKVSCENMALLIQPKCQYIPFLTFKATGQAKGFVKGKNQTVIANFCPYCGKPVKEEAEPT